MKKIIILSVLTMFSLITLVQPFEAQEQNKVEDERTLDVQLEKSNYILLEPIYAKFKVTLPSTDIVPKISEALSIRVSFKGKTKQFRGITLNVISSGDPQPLPKIDNGELLGLIPGVTSSKDTKISSKQVVTEKDTFAERKHLSYEKEEIIDRVGDFFPEPGNYQIQFVLNGAKSNTIDITIEEPLGINKEAFDFLNKYEDAMSFYWIWKEKDGISLLETFVNKYGESVYGESAISFLGNVYLAKGEIDKAKAEFEKIKSSENAIVAKEANKSLADIARRRADLQNLEKQKEKPQ